MGNVAVTNGNKEAYSRPFDGKVYTFKPDVPEIVSEDAAAYLFAYGKSDADRKKILIRNGWQKNGLAGDEFGPDKAMKRLQAFVFKAAPDDEKPAKPSKKLAPATVEMLKEKEKRVPTGVNALTPGLEATGGMVHNKGNSTLHLPGKATPRLQPAP